VGGNPADTASWIDRLEQDAVKNVKLTGFVPNAELPLYQAAADVLLMPYEKSIAGSGGGNSAEICSPMKMFDYLASGRVILASDLPVFHEVLNENNAIFCPPEDCAKLWAVRHARMQNATPGCSGLKMLSRGYSDFLGTSIPLITHLPSS